MSTTYWPAAATRSDADRATMQTAAVNADPAASMADREQAAGAEMTAHESYRHAHGIPAYGPADVETNVHQPEYADMEAGQ